MDGVFAGEKREFLSISQQAKRDEITHLCTKNQVLFCAKNSIRATVNSKKYTLFPGEILIISALEPFSMVFEEKNNGYLYAFDDEITREFDT